MLRIIAGALGGRRLSVPPGRHTRPTADKVREGLFNTLGSLVELEEARVADLFAGSGALGIEALSRGAAHAVFVEAHPRTAALIRANLEALALGRERARVVVARAEAWLAQPAEEAPATLALLDPPYDYAARDHAARDHAARDHAARDHAAYGALLAALARSPRLAAGAVVVLETARRTLLEAPPGLEPLRVKRYGDTQLWYFGREAPSAPVDPREDRP
jgi:16S rRNA (guanine966-N2)-methyltransferase